MSTQPIHVPRVWEVTGKAPEDRRRAVREWKQTYKQLQQGSSLAARHIRRESRSR